MTEQSGVAVRELLPATFVKLASTVQSKISQTDGSSPNIPGFAWNIVAAEASTSIQEALDCDVFEVLARGWAFANELREYRDKPKGTKSLVYLDKHALTTEIHPILNLYIDNVPCRPLRFTVELKANFQLAALLITDAHIVGLDAGDCSVSAQLKYGDVALHDALESKHLKLPGRLRFQTPLSMG